MSMRINTNLDALNAQRNLSTTGLAYSKSVAETLQRHADQQRRRRRRWPDH